MTQNYELDIKNQIQTILADSAKHFIRLSQDWNVVNIGDLQIQNLNFGLFHNNLQLSEILTFDPFDSWSVLQGDGTYTFRVTKYGLSAKSTLDSYKPLWKLGAASTEQAIRLWKKIEETEKNGAPKFENGIEIIPETPLWNTVDTLATKARQSFKTQLIEKLNHIQGKNQYVDGEQLWNAGVPVTLDVANVLKSLSAQMSR